MQKVRVPINSFQFGEISDSMVTRTDTPVYAQSASRVENFIIELWKRELRLHENERITLIQAIEHY